MKIPKKEQNRRLAVFEKSVRKYIEFFGLHEYELFFDIQEQEKIRASCLWHNMSGCQNANFLITGSWLFEDNWDSTDKPTDTNIDKIAFHEVCELLLAQLRDFAEEQEKVVSMREIDKESHTIIRILENKVLPLLGKRK